MTLEILTIEQDDEKVVDPGTAIPLADAVRAAEVVTGGVATEALFDPNDDAEEDEEDADEADEAEAEAEENHGPPWDIYLVNPTSGELLEVEVDAADGTVLDVETAEDFAQEFEDDGTEEDGDAA